MAQCKQECRHCEDRCRRQSNENGHKHDCGEHPHLQDACDVNCDHCKEQATFCRCVRKGAHLVHDCGHHGVLQNIQAGISLTTKKRFEATKKAVKKAELRAAYGGRESPELRFYKKLLKIFEANASYALDSQTECKLLAMKVTRAFNGNKTWKPAWDAEDKDYFNYYNVTIK